MLPRLKPACFEDIVAEVAIMRPGPIQGGAVHPYLRRRAGEEPVAYAHPCLEPALKETLGVLLFQEQAIRVAMAAAGFTPGEADALRRALTRYDYDGDPSFQSNPVMAAMRERFMAGAIANGLPQEVAASIFQQLAAFAGYSFCKSHAASFALIAYQTLWLKHYQPAAFYCALLNHQPMGYYAPEVIVGDARRHGIDLLPPDINRSGWGYTIERRTSAEAPVPPSPGTGARSTGEEARDIGGGLPGLRIGLQTVAGLGESGWQRIRDAREVAPFADLRDVCVRARLPQSTMSDLIRAGTMDAFGERRRLLWELGEIDYRPGELPLVAPVTPVELPDLDEAEGMAWEYELLGLSPAGQMMQHYRPALRRAGVLSAAEARAQRAGRRVRVAGLPMVRHRPGTAKGIVFIALEDETGLIDLIVRPDVYQRCRDALRHQPIVLADGVIQAVGGAISIMVTHAS